MEVIIAEEETSVAASKALRWILSFGAGGSYLYARLKHSKILSDNYKDITQDTAMEME